MTTLLLRGTASALSACAEMRKLLRPAGAAGSSPLPRRIQAHASSPWPSVMKWKSFPQIAPVVGVRVSAVLFSRTVAFSTRLPSEDSWKSTMREATVDSDGQTRMLESSHTHRSTLRYSSSAVPPQSCGCTSATDCENVHEYPAKSTATYCRSPYG